MSLLKKCFVLFKYHSGIQRFLYLEKLEDKIPGFNEDPSRAKKVHLLYAVYLAARWDLNFIHVKNIDE